MSSSLPLARSTHCLEVVCRKSWEVSPGHWPHLGFLFIYTSVLCMILRAWMADSVYLISLSPDSSWGTAHQEWRGSLPLFVIKGEPLTFWTRSAIIPTGFQLGQKKKKKKHKTKPQDSSTWPHSPGEQTQCHSKSADTERGCNSHLIKFSKNWNCIFWSSEEFIT